jgi:hypothetical protein
MRILTDKDTLMRASLFLIIAVSGNFVAETLNCKLQKALTDNVLMKNLVIILLIYCTLDLSIESDPHPATLVLKTIYVWIVFSLFNRTNEYVSVCLFVLFVCYHIGNKMKVYYHKHGYPDLSRRIDQILRVMDVLFVLLFIFGFVIYFAEKRTEYAGDKWDWFNFIFGVNRCHGLDPRR